MPVDKGDFGGAQGRQSEGGVAISPQPPELGPGGELLAEAPPSGTTSSLAECRSLSDGRTGDYSLHLLGFACCLP